MQESQSFIKVQSEENAATIAGKSGERHSPVTVSTLLRIHWLPVTYRVTLTYVLGGSEAASYSLAFWLTQHWLNFPASGWQF